MIYFKAYYKYQLKATYSVQTNLRPIGEIQLTYINLDMSGWLTIYYGYAWDGASGPVRDTDENMRASLIHDALYQLLRYGYLAGERQACDEEFRLICVEDGVWTWRAAMWYQGLRWFGEVAADPRSRKKVRTAP